MYNAIIKNEFIPNYILKDFSSWKIGGPAEFFYYPRTVNDLVAVLKTFTLKKITFLGAATNVLIDDRGVTGLVICLSRYLSNIKRIYNDTFIVEAGVKLNYLAYKFAEFGMIDAVFMAGIPGTLGGALKMNAGAYGKSIWDYVKRVSMINIYGEINIRYKKDFQIEYRKVHNSIMQEWFLNATLSFTPGDPEIAKKQSKIYLNNRYKSQPLNFPNCGSVFRNPPNQYAAKLIESSGLKGVKFGGAMVSEKHANFIINYNNAKSSDIINLIDVIIVKVKKLHNITLIPEVHIL